MSRGMRAVIFFSGLALFALLVIIFPPDHSRDYPALRNDTQTQAAEDAKTICQSDKVTCKNGMVYFKPDKKELHRMLDEKLSESDVDLDPAELEAAHELLDRELQD